MANGTSHRYILELISSPRIDISTGYSQSITLNIAVTAKECASELQGAWLFVRQTGFHLCCKEFLVAADHQVKEMKLTILASTTALDIPSSVTIELFLEDEHRAARQSFTLDTSKFAGGFFTCAPQSFMLTGPPGACKSSLINDMLTAVNARIMSVAVSGGGRSHTTLNINPYMLESNGESTHCCLIDCWGASEQTLSAELFEALIRGEIAPYSGKSFVMKLPTPNKRLAPGCLIVCLPVSDLFAAGEAGALMAEYIATAAGKHELPTVIAITKMDTSDADKPLDRDDPEVKKCINEAHTLTGVAHNRIVPVITHHQATVKDHDIAKNILYLLNLCLSISSTQQAKEENKSKTLAFLNC